MSTTKKNGAEAIHFRYTTSSQKKKTKQNKKTLNIGILQIEVPENNI